MIPSAFGVTRDMPPQLQTMAAQAAEVLVYYPAWHDGLDALEYADMAGVRARVMGLDRERALREYRAVLSFAAELPGASGKVVALGVCFGGPFAWMAAAEKRVQGVVVWHGSRLEGFLHLAEAISCPMILHIGERDRVMPLEARDAVLSAFRGQNHVRAVVHAGADHGFTHPTGQTWVPEAERQSLDSVVEMLQQVG
jgi:carboxymethylenebutenolidase